MAVFGIVSNEKTSVASSVYYGLFALQHRGQESAGIVVNDDGVFSTHKDSGLVNDVFSQDILESLGQGNMAIGHVRYGTLATKERVNAEPIVVNHIKGRLAVATSGSLVNAADIKRELEKSSHSKIPRKMHL
jgi:amidophosphoribosyltransferase